MDYNPVMNLLKLLSLPFLLAACSTSPQVYQAETPKMDFITYFSGETHGYGAIYGFTGKVTDRFHVAMQGTPGKNAQGQRTLDLQEQFTYSSGKTQKRAWFVTEVAPGKLAATAPDVPGDATGEESGNAVSFKYKITIERANGSSVTVGSDDWMWHITDDIILNRNQFTKFGIPVAELVISFTKQPPAKP